MNLHFASQACSEGTGLPLVARLVPGRRCRRGCWCGRRGTWRQRPSLLCVAGVALGDRDLHDSDLHFAWQAWPLSPRLLAWQAWRLAPETFTLHGKHCTSRHGPSLSAAFGVAGVALGDRDLAWQAWRLATGAFTLRGRRGTSRHGPSLCGTYGTGLPLTWTPLGVAGVAIGDRDLHFAW